MIVLFYNGKSVRLYIKVLNTSEQDVCATRTSYRGLAGCMNGVEKARKVNLSSVEESKITEAKSDGAKMAEALEKLSKNKAFAGVEPQKWQREIRQDRSLPHRD